MKVVWSAPAARDLHRLMAFYRRIDPDLSARMRERIDRAADSLRQLGNIGSPTPGVATFKKNVRGAPYLLDFTVQRNEIQITAVRHVRQNWRDDN